MDVKNPQDFVYGLTPFMQASRNGHLDLSRFFMHGIEEKIEDPIVRFLYLFKLLLLFPNLFFFLGFHWPSYLATICFALLAPFIYLAFYIYYSKFKNVFETVPKTRIHGDENLMINS